MDRFEVWLYRTYSAHNVHLHSSMDRFEGSFGIGYIYLNIIYIPVWIDLKYLKNQKESNQDLIYIPVWIDLK